MEIKEGRKSPIHRNMIVSYNNNGLSKTEELKKIIDYEHMLRETKRKFNICSAKCSFLYEDEDKDKITVTNDEDLEIALYFFNSKIPKFLFKIENNLKEIQEYSIIERQDIQSEESSLDYEIIEEETIRLQNNSEIDLLFQIPKENIAAPVNQEKIELIDDTSATNKNKMIERNRIECNNTPNVQPNKCLENKDFDVLEDRLRPAIPQNLNNPHPPLSHIQHEESCELSKQNTESCGSKERCLSSSAKSKHIKDFIQLSIQKEIQSMIPEISLLVQKCIQNKTCEDRQGNIQETKLLKGITLNHHNTNKHEYAIRKFAPVNNNAKDQFKVCNEAELKIHKDIQCNLCKQKPIFGNRYVCLICRDYDLCEKCEFNKSHKHPLLKVKSEDQLNKFLKYCKIKSKR